MSSLSEFSIDDLIVDIISPYLPFSTLYLLAKTGSLVWMKATGLQMKERSTREISLVAIVHDDQLLMEYLLSSKGLYRRITDEMITLAIQECKYLALYPVISSIGQAAARKVVAWDYSLRDLYQYADIKLLKLIHAKLDIPFADLNIEWDLMKEEIDMNIDIWLRKVSKIFHNYYLVSGRRMYKYLLSLPDEIFAEKSEKIYDILKLINVPVECILLCTPTNASIKQTIRDYCEGRPNNFNKVANSHILYTSDIYRRQRRTARDVHTERYTHVEQVQVQDNPIVYDIDLTE